MRLLNTTEVKFFALFFNTEKYWMKIEWEKKIRFDVIFPVPIALIIKILVLGFFVQKSKENLWKLAKDKYKQIKFKLKL